MPPTLPCRAAALAVTAAALALSGCAAAGAGAAAPAARPATRAAAAPSGSAAAASPAPSPSPQHPAGPLPLAPGTGRLPQTHASPRASGPAFQALSSDLWRAVSTGDAALARPAFFPVRAYAQVKAIWNPAGDWRYRLWLDFSLDVVAAHRLLGRSARQARLVRVIVPSAAAAWVGPGTCYNRAGYWHVGGPRVVYRLHGQERSFGIASLISWRGVWYVIHFGGITRPAVGMVDGPAAGPGYPGPQGGC
jgi:hypothetical protein